MANTVETLEKLEAFLPETTIVTDVCSLKKFVAEREYSFDFIGSHPMAGTEKAGYENSFEEMFEDAKWVLTPSEKTSNESILQLESVIKKMGAKVVYAEPDEHDEAVAKISHMPMLLSQALFDMAQGDELAMELASSGFRDMTRLAMSNIDMADDMVRMNEKNISNAMLALQESIVGLKTDYKERIADIKALRADMYDANGKNVK